MADYEEGSGASKTSVMVATSSGGDGRVVSIPHQHSNEHINLLVKGLYNLRNHSTLCDVTICINETEKGPPIKFPSHKCVLAASSGYFRDRLGVPSHGFEGVSATSVTSGPEVQARPASASSGGRDQVNEISLDFPISREAMRVVLDFLYTAVLDTKPESIPGILEAATKMRITSLRRRCLAEIKHGFRLKYFTSLLGLSHALNIRELRDFVLCQAAERFDDFTDTSCFLKLTQEELEEIVNSRNGTLSNSCVIPELQMFNAILKWQKHDKKERILPALKLLKCLHYKKIPLSTLSGYVLKQELIANNKELLDSIEEILGGDKRRILQRLKRQQSNKNAANNGSGDVIVPTRAALVVTGGRLFDQFTSQVLELNLKDDAWREITRLPTTLCYHQVAVVANVLYVAGGEETSMTNVWGSACVWSYQPVANEWEALPDMHQGRAYFYLGSVDDNLYAIGGRSSKIIRTSVEKYSTSSKKWEFVATLKSPRYFHSGCVHKLSVYVTGGIVRKSSSSDLIKYDPETNHWTQMSPMLAPRSCHSMAAVRDRIFVFAGEQESHGVISPVSTAIECYIPLGDQWHKVAQKISFQGEKECACAELNGLIYLMGGSRHNLADHRYDVTTYDPETDLWRGQAKLPRRLKGAAGCVLLLN